MLQQSSIVPDRLSAQTTLNPNSNNGAGNSGLPKSASETNFQVRRSADQLLRTGHTNGLHDLLLEQVSRSETLMNDNALMQRQLYKYETTLAELDVILRSEKRDQQVFELKKIIESQLKQIVVLQKEVEMARQGQTISNNCLQS